MSKVAQDVRDKYKATIGIETHVQLKTKTKLFSAVANDARDAKPNTLVNHIDFGLPGALPVLNNHAVELACRTAFALNTEPQKISKFDRKHYFYPDLPKGYQITQFYEPVMIGGYVEIGFDGETKKVRLHHAHIEEDAGKSTHPIGKDYSLVDLNRAGTPLLEIVSEPDIHSPEEAKAYAHELWLVIKYANVSEASLFYGNMRFDVNVSVSKTDQLGTRTETKNLNSFKSVEKAAEYEISRQIDLLEQGEKVAQETRGWLDDESKTVSQRGKEEAHDYRYMPEPDLPPINLSEKFVNDIKANLPLMPSDYRERFTKIDIDTKTINDIIAQPDVAITVSEVLNEASPEDARRIAFWLLGGAVAAEESESSDNLATNIDVKRLIKLSKMVAANKLSSTAAKEVVAAMITDKNEPEEIAKQLNLLQVSDEGEIAKIVEQVLADNEKAATDVKNGEMRAIGFLVGQVMKASKGKANPQMTQELIKKVLGI